MSRPGRDPVDQVPRSLRSDARFELPCQLLLMVSGIVIVAVGLVAQWAAVVVDTVA